MLEIRDLHVRYGGIQAVQGVSLSIPRGSIVTLIGANGAGKSSIIRSIAGLNKTISGEILFTRHEGEEPVSLMGLKPEGMVRKGISLSPEGRRILPHLSVEENLYLGAPGMGLHPFPAPQGAQLAEGRHPVRRRAADAGRGPGAHESSGPAHARRALAGPCALAGA